jgi:hypothetical protein
MEPVASLETVTEAQISTHPAKLLHTTLSFSTDASREIALGFSRRADTQAMCSVHYAN